MFRAAALAAAAVLTVAVTHAAEMPPLTPYSSAADIRAARNAAPGGELQLVYQFIDEKYGQSVRTVGVGDDYAYVASTTVTTLFDFKLRRIITVDGTAGTLSSESMYGPVAARTLELDDRVDAFLTRTDAEKAAAHEADDPFWIEATAGMVSDDLPRSQFSRVPFPSQGVQYRYRNDAAARFTPADSDATEAEVATLNKLWRHILPIHPAIFAEIVATHKVPSVISFEAFEDGQKLETQYRLRGMRRASAADYPLSPDLQVTLPQANDGPAFVKTLVPVLDEALAGRYGGGPRSPESYRQALAGGYDNADLRTVLTYIEFISNYGPRVVSCPTPPAPGAACHTIKEVIDRAMERDPRVRPYVTGIFGQAREPDRVVDTWAKMKKDDLPNAYVLDMAAANSLSSRGIPADAARAEELYANVLKGNAYLAGVYKDIGDHLMRAYDTSSAWLFYDTGRALPGNVVGGLLDSISAYERQIAADHPEFF